MTISATLRPAFSLPSSEPAGTAPRVSDRDSLRDEHDFETLVEHAERLAKSGLATPQRGQPLFGTDLLHLNSQAVRPIVVGDTKLGAGRKHFSAEASVSDHAVAFASRPLVAPAAVQHRSKVEHVLPAQGQPTIIGSELENALDQMVLLELGGDRANVNFVTTSVQPRAGKPAATGDQAPSPTPFRATNGAPLPGSPSAITSLANRTSQHAVLRSSGAAQNAKSAPMQTTHHLQSSNPLFAQLVPNSSEYRILVRGQRLGDLDRDHLIQSMSLTIAQLGLPMQPVHIALPKGSA